jgi:hypothetical protein
MKQSKRFGYAQAGRCQQRQQSGVGLRS